MPTSDTIWYHWNSTASTTITADYWTDAWPTTWISTTTTIAEDVHWQRWAQSWAMRYVDTVADRLTVETEQRVERIAQREREQAERERAREVQRAAERIAERTARELLLAHLDAGQKRDALEHGWFEVTSDKGRRWRIHLDGMSGNVDLMPEVGDVRLASYCAHGSEAMPLSDHHLVQKLALENDDEQFIAVANLHYRNAAAIRDGVEIPDRRAGQPRFEGVYAA